MSHYSSSSRWRLAARLYDVFARYSDAGREFCAVCYSPEEWEAISRSPAGALGVENARKLLWETADHWESADVYRHYLPRLLELLGPPWLVDDLYPLHLFETLIALGFRRWSRNERTAVVEYLEHISPQIAHTFSEKDRSDWAAGIAALKNPTLALPAAPGGER